MSLATSHPGNHDKDRPAVRVSIVIPVHNRVTDTLECLHSLQSLRYPAYEIVIVDDGSTDGTAQLVHQHFPQVRILAGDGNLWWSGAVNLGIPDALSRSFEFVLLLNNDSVISPDSLSWLVATANKHPGDVVGSVVYDYANREQLRFCGGKMDWRCGGPVKLKEQDLVNAAGLPYPTDFYGARGVLVPRSVFDLIGLFDETTFPHYWGDMDFWVRARQAGIKLWIDPRSIVWDKRDDRRGQSTSTKVKGHNLVPLLFSRRSAWNLRDGFLFFFRHCPPSLLPFALRRRYAPVFRQMRRQIWTSTKAFGRRWVSKYRR